MLSTTLSLFFLRDPSLCESELDHLRSSLTSTEHLATLNPLLPKAAMIKSLCGFFAVYFGGPDAVIVFMNHLEKGQGKVLEKIETCWNELREGQAQIKSADIFSNANSLLKEENRLKEG
jgi:hypothetical protein